MFTAVTGGADRARGSRCSASDETPSSGRTSPPCGASAVSSIRISLDEVGELSVKSKRTFDVEDKADVVLD